MSACASTVLWKNAPPPPSSLLLLRAREVDPNRRNSNRNIIATAPSFLPSARVCTDRAGTKSSQDDQHISVLNLRHAGHPEVTITRRARTILGYTLVSNGSTTVPSLPCEKKKECYYVNVEEWLELTPANSLLLRSACLDTKYYSRMISTWTRHMSFSRVPLVGSKNK